MNERKQFFLVISTIWRIGHEHVERRNLFFLDILVKVTFAVNDRHESAILKGCLHATLAEIWVVDAEAAACLFCILLLEGLEVMLFAVYFSCKHFQQRCNVVISRVGRFKVISIICLEWPV